MKMARTKGFERPTAWFKVRSCAVALEGHVYMTVVMAGIFQRGT
jgi:hypothetical protein